MASASWYREHYLKSAHWSDLRLKKLAETDARCEICQRQNFANDVHHIQYKALFDVETDDLRVLCRECHTLIHYYLEQLRSYKRDEAIKEWWKCVKMVRDNMAASFHPAWIEARKRLIQKKKDSKTFLFEDELPPVNHKAAIDWFYSAIKEHHREPFDYEWETACLKWGTWPRPGDH